MSRRVSSLKAVAMVVLVCACSPAYAEDFPLSKSGDAEFEKGFDEKRGFTELDKDVADQDRLKIGGTLWNEFQYAEFSPGSSEGGYFFNPNSLWIYLDSRLRNDVRGVVKLRAIYDPTVTGATANPLTGASGQKFTSDLQEMKLLFSVKKSVFFTIGKQKVKWGSGKFWNPTDFLNSSRRNFLYSADLRSGVSQIKTHVPVGSSNLYLIHGLDDANRLAKLGHTLRAEIPIQGTGEVAVSAASRGSTPPIFGLDLSTALWELDAYGEVAYSAGNTQTFFSPFGTATDPTSSVTNWVAGLSYETAYSDSDNITFGVEYFRNELGYTNSANYPFVFLGGGYVPFHLSKHYGMFMVYLPKPGGWNQTTFTLFNLVNLTDKSAMTRLDALMTMMDDLSFDIAVGVHYGEGDGEFKIGGQRLDVAGRLMIDF